MERTSHDQDLPPDFFHIIPYEIQFQTPEDQKKLNVETLELKGAYSISFWFLMQNNPDSISKNLILVFFTFLFI